MENRKTLRISGVLDIDGFTDSKVILNTTMGELIIKGEDLHINTLTADNGDFQLTGNIASLIYSSFPSTSNIFKKLFR